MKPNQARRVVPLAVSLAVALGLAPVASALQDQAGCRDHPLFPRMKDYHIRECSSKPLGKVELFTGKGRSVELEGQTTEVNYACDREEGFPGRAQVLGHYRNAVESLGGAAVYEWEDGVTLKLTRDGREIWVSVDVASEGFYHTLKVVEVERK